jgi:hypothetical protein
MAQNVTLITRFKFIGRHGCNQVEPLLKQRFKSISMLNVHLASSYPTRTLDELILRVMAGKDEEIVFLLFS